MTKRLGGWFRAAAVVAAAASVAACGGSLGHARANIPPSSWRPPPPGPPSVTSFCSQLRVVEAHLAELAQSRSRRQSEQVLVDYADALPSVVAAAPPDIAPVARTYFTVSADFLRAYVANGLSLKDITARLPAGVRSLQASPQITQQLESYVAQNCRFSLTNPNPNAGTGT